ncbi:MAG TPA: hypothetical protein VJH63_03940 [Candidatus Paceibacterota bacterium]
MNKSFFDTRAGKIICIILGSIIILYQVPNFFRSFVCTIDEATGECLSLHQNIESEGHFTNEEFNNASQEEQAAMVKSVYIRVHRDAVKNADIPGFYEFYVKEINTKCPFYEPDGVSYRSCLNDLLDKTKKESALSKALGNIESVEGYCNETASPYEPGNEAVSLFLDCMIFKLSI